MRTPQLSIHGVSDQGILRERNEDSYACDFPESHREMARRGALIVVADGMGGIGRGDIASKVAVEAVLKAYLSSGAEPSLEHLRMAMQEANRAVYEEKVRHSELGPMGATCTAGVIRGREAFLAHVGDCRAYLVRDRSARQLTADHSLVAQLVREHRLEPDKAQSDPRRNVVTRGLGIEEKVTVDAFQLPDSLEQGDTLVLCTDGLHGQVSDAELAELASNVDLAGACRDLVDLANRHGGPDNITVMLARIGPDVDGLPDAVDSASTVAIPADEERGGQEVLRPNRRGRARLALAIIGSLLLLALLALLLVRRGGSTQTHNASAGRSQTPAGAP